MKALLILLNVRVGLMSNYTIKYFDLITSFVKYSSKKSIIA